MIIDTRRLKSTALALITCCAISHSPTTARRCRAYDPSIDATHWLLCTDDWRHCARGEPVKPAAGQYRVEEEDY
jgi:hypothetical protein